MSSETKLFRSCSLSRAVVGTRSGNSDSDRELRNDLTDTVRELLEFEPVDALDGLPLLQ